MAPLDSAQPTTMDSLKAIIRRDLNLGAGEAVTDDMPLIGGDLDLDSLDVLMLVTSIEKQYGIKISSEQHGQEAFESVATLAAFIERQAGGGAAAGGGNGGPGAGGSSAVDRDAALAALPHQSPFRFVSEVVALEPGERGVGRWVLTGEEAFFAGHFPGKALVPGVLVSEALAQVSGIVFASGQTGTPEGPGAGAGEGRLAGVEVKFRSPVSPPATIELESALSKSHGDLHVFEVVARCGGDVVAEGLVTLFQAVGE